MVVVWPPCSVAGVFVCVRSSEGSKQLSRFCHAQTPGKFRFNFLLLVCRYADDGKAVHIRAYSPIVCDEHTLDLLQTKTECPARNSYIPGIQRIHQEGQRGQVHCIDICLECWRPLWWWRSTIQSHFIPLSYPRKLESLRRTSTSPLMHCTAPNKSQK